MNINDAITAATGLTDQTEIAEINARMHRMFGLFALQGLSRRQLVAGAKVAREQIEQERSTAVLLNDFQKGSRT